MIVGDLAVADHQVVREHAAHRLVEAAADGLVGHFELGCRSSVLPACTSSIAFSTKCMAQRRRVGLEVGAGAVALDGVAPLGDLPLEFDLAASWPSSAGGS